MIDRASSPLVHIQNHGASQIAMDQIPRNGQDCRHYRDEILVHIAAASTAQDDARYRAQVAAILSFQCASRQPLMATQIEPVPDRDCHAHPISATAGVHLHSSSITQHEASSIVREASRPAFSTLYSDLPSRPERDGAAPREYISNPISNHHASLESLISVIPDSQPEIANELVYASPSRAELSSPSQHDPPPKRPRTAPISPDHPDSSPESIPIPSAPDQPAAPQRVNPISIPSSDPEPFPTSQPHPPEFPPSNPNPPTILLSLPLQIHPPKPPISTAPFTTHITPTLSMLTERLTPSRIYNPSHQSRPLDPLERGYWLVRFAINPQQDLTSNQDEPHIWPEPLFNAFWSFLRDFVGRDGRAGWGVWCILETDSVSTGSAAMQLVLKVYTWGEVAMHVYLLLFLASERRVRGMGVQWRDAREEVVIQMP